MYPTVRLDVPKRPRAKKQCSVNATLTEGATFLEFGTRAIFFRENAAQGIYQTHQKERGKLHTTEDAASTQAGNQAEKLAFPVTSFSSPWYAALHTTVCDLEWMLFMLYFCSAHEILRNWGSDRPLTPFNATSGSLLKIYPALLGVEITFFPKKEKGKIWCLKKPKLLDQLPSLIKPSYTFSLKKPSLANHGLKKQIVILVAHKDNKKPPKRQLNLVGPTVVSFIHANPKNLNVLILFSLPVCIFDQSI